MKLKYLLEKIYACWVRVCCGDVYIHIYMSDYTIEGCIGNEWLESEVLAIYATIAGNEIVVEIKEEC